MPFNRPTLSDLVVRIRADFKSRLSITGQIVRRSMANILATVWAGAVHTLHGHLSWLALQLFADSADGEYLLRIASLYGYSLIPAEFAKGGVTATGVNGTAIPIGTFLVRDDGARYEVKVGAVIAGGTATVQVQAVLAGSAGNMASGTLEFETPIPGIATTATVDSSGLVSGVDEETIEQLRVRLLLRLREPPTGGSDQDYEGWALAVPGVTRVWVYAHENGLGTVVVRFVRDGDVSIFPDAGEVATVQTQIDSERPTTADVTVYAPTELAQPFTIAIVPDTPAIRSAVEASLTDMLFQDAEPGDGMGRGTILLSRIRTAIGIASGVSDYTVSVPVADVVPAVGELVTLGVVTWV